MTSDITHVPIVDDAVFTELVESLRGADGAAHLDRLIAKFADISRGTLDALTPAVLADRLDEVAHLAHALRGGSAMVGAARVVQLAEILESAARTGDLAWAPRLLTHLDAALTEACATLQTRR